MKKHAAARVQKARAWGPIIMNGKNPLDASAVHPEAVARAPSSRPPHSRRVLK